jgi:hypothetical protein
MPDAASEIRQRQGALWAVQLILNQPGLILRLLGMNFLHGPIFSFRFDIKTVVVGN